MSLYEILFGCKVKVELNTSSLSKQIIDNFENKVLQEMIEKKNEIKNDDQDK